MIFFANSRRTIDRYTPNSLIVESLSDSLQLIVMRTAQESTISDDLTAYLGLENI